MLTGVTIKATCNLRPPSTGSAQCCKSSLSNIQLIVNAPYEKIDTLSRNLLNWHPFFKNLLLDSVTYDD